MRVVNKNVEYSIDVLDKNIVPELSVHIYSQADLLGIVFIPIPTVMHLVNTAPILASVAKAMNGRPIDELEMNLEPNQIKFIIENFEI